MYSVDQQVEYHLEDPTQTMTDTKKLDWQEVRKEKLTRAKRR